MATTAIGSSCLLRSETRGLTLCLRTAPARKQENRRPRSRRRGDAFGARAGAKTGERDWAGEQETGRGAGDGEQENGIGQENRKRDAARGDGEQENGIWVENK